MIIITSSSLIGTLKHASLMLSLECTGDRVKMVSITVQIMTMGLRFNFVDGLTNVLPSDMEAVLTSS